MDHRELEEIGENLRSLGHERREVVQQIMSSVDGGSPEVGKLYRELDEISERAIGLMERQRNVIRQELGDQIRQ